MLQNLDLLHSVSEDSATAPFFCDTAAGSAAPMVRMMVVMVVVIVRWSVCRCRASRNCLSSICRCLGSRDVAVPMVPRLLTLADHHRVSTASKAHVVVGR
jgi:hypothetical protein